MKWLKFNSLVAVAAILVLAATVGWAATINVNNSMTTAQINTAIAGASSGDVVQFANGTYNLTAPLVVGVAGVILQGDITTPSNVIIDMAGAGDDKDGFQVTANGVTIKGFYIENALSSATAQNAGIWVGPQIDGGTFSYNVMDNNGFGIYVHESRNIVISHNEVKNSKESDPWIGGRDQGKGIMLYNQPPSTYVMTGNTIDHNEVHDNERNGIHVAWNNPGDMDDKLSFSGTIISNNNVYDNDWDNLEIRQASGSITVDSNTFQNSTTKHGIWLQYTSNVDIKYNTISGNAKYGIELQAASDVDIKNNTISGNVQYNARVCYSSNNITITGNDFTSSGWAGLIVGNTGGLGSYPTNVVVNFNNFSTTADYLWVHEYTGTLDATKNWWGDVNGPNVNSSGPGSVGPLDIEPGMSADYSPWLGNSPITGTAPNIATAAHPWTWHTNDSIQDAIDEASAGDTIKVHDGTYTERITVNKQLTIRAASSPIIDVSSFMGTYPYNVGVLISANGVTFDGFEVKGSDGFNTGTNQVNWGIYLSQVTSCTISNNTVRDISVESWVGAGIVLYRADNNTISSNTVTSNRGDGIDLCGLESYGGDGCDTNAISGNTCTDNGWNGIILNWNCSNNTVENNTTNDNRMGICIARESNTNTFTGNIATGNSVAGVYIQDGAAFNTLTGNTLTGNCCGVLVWDEGGGDPHDNAIHFNNISGNIGGCTWNGGSTGEETPVTGVHNSPTVAATVNATKNWWGHYSGPSTSKGSGDRVSANVDYDPWLHGWTSNGLGLKYITQAQGQWHTSAPALDLTFYDGGDGGDLICLTGAYYQYDSYSGSWTEILPSASGSEKTYAGWTLPGFNSLSDGSHTIYFKAKDDDAPPNEEGESGEWSWQFNKEATPPTVPVLIAPANGAALTDRTPTFIWHASTDAYPGVDKYEIMYADNPTFSGPSKVVKYLTDTTYTPPSDLTADMYYWAVKAIDGLGNSSFWSDKWSFTYDNVPPAAPTLVSPIGGVWLDDTLVTCEWTSVTHKGAKEPGTPVHYIFQLDDNSSFSSPFTDTTDVTSYNLTLMEDFYHWRVRAYDDAGNQGSFSGTESFGVDITPPGRPTLVSPPDSALQNNPVLVFIWNTATDNPSSGIDHYVLEYASSTSATSVNVTDTSYVTDTLTDDTYSWRVKAVDRAGNEGLWTSFRYVTIDTQAPGVPVLISPPDSSYINTIMPTFVWEAATSTYCLQVGLDATFNNLIIDTCGLADTFYTVTDSSLFDTLTYYWRVEVIDDANNHSGYQIHPFMFTIDTIPPPTPPTLLLPSDSSYTNDNTPTFVWTAVLDSPITYCLQVTTDTSFDSAFVAIDSCGLTDTIFTVADTLPLADEIYHWRVEALDRAGNTSGYQEPFMFTIDTQAPIFTLTTVWDDTSFAGPYLISSVITDALSGVDSAFLYYSFDAGTTWTSIVMQLAPPDTYEADIPQVPDSSNTTIQYYLMANDPASNVGYDPIGAPDSSYSFVGGATTDEKLGTEEQKEPPTTFVIHQNLPNPFSQSTVISYSLPVSADGGPQSAVNLRIYNLSGRLVRTIVDELQKPGYYKVVWDGKDDAGKPVTNGIYFYKVQFGNFIQIKKMILIR